MNISSPVLLLHEVMCYEHLFGVASTWGDVLSTFLRCRFYSEAMCWERAKLLRVRGGCCASSSSVLPRGDMQILLT